MLLSVMLRHLVRRGKLTVVDARGRTHEFAGVPGPELTVCLHDPKLHWKLFANPRLYLGEAFMDGTLTIERASIYDLMQFLAQAEDSGGFLAGADLRVARAGGPPGA